MFPFIPDPWFPVTHHLWWVIAASSSLFSIVLGLYWAFSGFSRPFPCHFSFVNGLSRYIVSCFALPYLKGFKGSALRGRYCNIPYFQPLHCPLQVAFPCLIVPYPLFLVFCSLFYCPIVLCPFPIVPCSLFLIPHCSIVPLSFVLCPIVLCPIVLCPIVLATLSLYIYILRYL